MEQLGYSSEDKAPFNMAIDTLRRIGGILDEIHKVACDGILSPEQKQNILVPLVQHFFFQASPLLKEEVVTQYQTQVLSLKSIQVAMAMTRCGITKKKEVKLLYDPELDLKMNILLLNIQRELQKEKYFMPPKKDLSRAVTEM